MRFRENFKKIEESHKSLKDDFKRTEEQGNEVMKEILEKVSRLVGNP